MAIKKFFLRVISVFIATLALLFYVGVCDHAEWDVEDPDACLLHFDVLSDVHTEGNNAMRYKVFVRAMQDVRKDKSGSDAVLFLGDNTMNGSFGENVLFHGAVRTVLRRETVLTVLGNHDVGNGQGDGAQLLDRWLLFTNAFFGRQLDRPYYAQEINGYTFIVLGAQVASDYGVDLFDEQLEWLQGVLDGAADSGKPVFIFSHYPMTYDNFGDVLSNFGAEHDLFCFVGHTHMPLSRSSFRSGNGYKQVYLPRLTELSGENDNELYSGTGDGVEVEVYDDEIVVRARDYFRGEWISAKDGTPLEVRYALRTAAETEEG